MPRKNEITKPVGLCCDNIGDLDNGIAAAIVDKAIQEALVDLDERGEADGKARKVQIEITLAYHDGLVLAHLGAQAKVPPRRTNTVAGKPRRKSKEVCEFLFQPTNSENPDQGTFLADGEIPNED